MFGNPAQIDQPTSYSLSVSMLSRTVALVVLASFFVFGFGAGEASAAKLLTIDSEPIEASLSLAEISKRIQVAGQKRGWKVKETAPGQIDAIIHVRTHMARIEIKFDTAQYSILYKDSENLKYKEGKIHRAYNNWVTNLKNDIQVELAF